MGKQTIIFFLGFFLLSFFSHSPVFSQDTPQETLSVIFFYSPTCSKCAQLKDGKLKPIEREFKGRIRIEYRDISEIENYTLLLSLRERFSVEDTAQVVPAVYFEGKFLSNSAEIQKKIRSVILSSLRLPTHKQGGIRLQPLPSADLISRFKGFEPLAIIGAGLLDGVNPCAFTVIVFFVSFLALQGYKRRELIIIGLSFIVSVFLTYILLGLGLFGFLYRLQGFWLLSRLVNIFIGIASIILGVFAVADFFTFKKTKSAEGLFLQLPKTIKNRIHSVIGKHYRKTQETLSKRNLCALAASAFITGCLVSMLEAVCTGQMYLPTIVFVLKTTPFKLRALGYLALYNVMFILPLAVIFIYALLGVSSGQFSRFLQRRLLTIKILMAALFFGFGIAILFAYAPLYPEETKNAVKDSLKQEQASVEPLAGDAEVWDFGTVTEGQVLKHAFVLRNDSQRTLNIKNVNTSCGCILSRVEKNALAPGESTSAQVTFNTKGYFGQTQQFVYLHTDNLKEPVIKFTVKANVTQ